MLWNCCLLARRVLLRSQSQPRNTRRSSIWRGSAPPSPSSRFAAVRPKDGEPKWRLINWTFMKQRKVWPWPHFVFGTRPGQCQCYCKVGCKAEDPREHVTTRFAGCLIAASLVSWLGGYGNPDSAGSLLESMRRFPECHENACGEGFSGLFSMCNAGNSDSFIHICLRGQMANTGCKIRTGVC